MLRWCANCQRFQGEAAPFDDFNLTHGICPTCAPLAKRLTDGDVARIEVIKAIHGRLMEAGWRRDLATAARILEEARGAGIRSVDMLLATVTSLLYEVGEAWKRAAMTVEEEHRFTAFCDALYERIAVVSDVSDADAPFADGWTDALLMNAPGNRHTLGARILALWLTSQGAHVTVVAPDTRLDVAMALITRRQPRMVMISMALAEQRDDVVRIVERIAALAVPSPPKIVVGGYAVKLGLVAPIPGVDLSVDLPTQWSIAQA